MVTFYTIKERLFTFPYFLNRFPLSIQASDPVKNRPPVFIAHFVRYLMFEVEKVITYYINFNIFLKENYSRIYNAVFVYFINADRHGRTIHFYYCKYGNCCENKYCCVIDRVSITRVLAKQFPSLWYTRFSV